MALNRNTKYPGRYDAPTPAQPQGAFKNRTSPTSQDGSYMERDWLNDWSAFFSSLLVKAGITPNGDVDEVGASQYMDAFEQLIAEGEVDPLNNDWNGYFDPAHQEQLPSPAGYPATTLTPYGLDDEWSLNCFSGSAGNTISSEVDGVVFTGSIYKKYEFTTEQIDNIDVNKVPVYIKDQDGKEYFFKNGDTGVTVSKLGTTLTVTISNAIFTVPGITKVWRFFVTESVGRVAELNPESVRDILSPRDSDNLKPVTAFAWVLFLGDGTIVASFNVLSVSKAATGVYVITTIKDAETVNFNTMVSGRPVARQGHTFAEDPLNSPTLNTVTVFSHKQGVGNQDPISMNVVIYEE